jgi:tRNA (pseudouridine54-N1)-methyltransferase
MREFIYYSANAVTAGNMIKDNLMQAGRMDIVLNVLISALFVSNAMRDDVKLHLIFDGPPSAPRHLILESNKDMPISKKDVAGLIKRMLYKCDEKKTNEVFPGCFIEKKSFEALVKELDKEGKDVLLLDEGGKDIRDLKLKGNEVFILGDHDGFPKDKQRFLKTIDKISVGPRVLFASQVMVLIHNEIDRQE